MVALRGEPGELSVGVRHALLGLAEQAAVDAAPRWRERLRRTAEDGGRRLAAELLRELDRIELTPRRRRWWAPLGWCWTLVELVFLAGAGWLTASAVLAWLQLPPLPAPDVTGAVSLPTTLLLGGAVAWWLVAAVRTRLVRRGARRHRAAVSDRVAAELRDRARGAVLQPLADEVGAIRDLHRHLGVAAA